MVITVARVYRNALAVVDNGIVAVKPVNHDVIKRVFNTVIARRAAQDVIVTLETRHKYNRVIVGIGDEHAFRRRKRFAFLKVNRVNVNFQVFGFINDDTTLADLDNHVVAANYRGVFALDFDNVAGVVAVNDILSVALRVIDDSLCGFAKVNVIVARPTAYDVCLAANKDNIISVVTVDFILTSMNKNKVIIFSAFNRA